MPTAQDLMSTDVVTIDGSATAADAVEKMRDYGVRCLIVERRSEDDAYGIITQRDICYGVIAPGKDPAGVAVHEIMSKPLVLVNQDIDIPSPG